MRQALRSTLFGALLGVLIPSLAFGQATLMPDANQRYFNDAGQPVANGQVFYYIPNTTTKKTVWQDAAQTTPQANPVSLDAGGKPQPAGQTFGSGCYQQQVKDVNGIQIWSAVTCSVGGGSGGSGGVSTSTVPVGAIIPWAGTTLPANYLYTAGQAVSRITYPQLLTAITTQLTILCQSGVATISVPTAVSDIMPKGAPIEASCFAPGTVVSSKTSGQLTLSNNATTSTSVSAVLFPWNNGDGATTFNLPDTRGRGISGRDNMNASIAGVLNSTYYTTTGGAGVNPDAMNAVGGSQAWTTTLAQLPTNISSSEVAASPNNQLGIPNSAAAVSNFATTASGGGGTNVPTSSSPFSNANQLTIPISVISDNTSGLPHSSIQPTVTADHIIKVLPDPIIPFVLGFNVLAPSNLVTTDVLPNTPTYNNGTAGVGASLAAGSNSTLTVDGTVATLGSVVLVNNQASAFQNGIYTVTTAGSGSAPWVLTRASYFNSPAQMVAGSYTFIQSGATQAGSSWVLTTAVAAVGTSPINFILFSSPSGLSLIANTTLTSGFSPRATLYSSAGLLKSGAAAAYTPEQYGAIGDGAADDTNAWINMCAAVQSAGGGQIIAGVGKTYKVWPTAPADQSTLCNLTGAVNGLRVDMQGATINVAYSTGTAIVYVFNFDGGQHIEINDLVGISGAGKHVSGDTIGTQWVTCSNEGGSGFGCRDMAVRRANITGGLDGVAIARAPGTGLSSWGIRVTGTFTNVGYPVSNQFDGLNTSFDIVTNNPGRSYIGYNVAGVRGRINSTNNPSLNDVEIAAVGVASDISNNTTANVSIEYINRTSTSYGASQLSISHQQSIATKISNVTFNVDILYSGTPATELIEENSFSPDPGNTDDNITIAGKIEGDVSSTYIGCLLTTANGNCSGFNGTSTGTYFLSNLQIPTSSKPWAIGTGVTNTFGPNYAQPNATSPTYDAGSTIQLSSFVQPVVFSGSPSPSFNGALNIWDPNSPNSGVRLRKGSQLQAFTSSDVEDGLIAASGGAFFITTVIAAPVCFGYNSAGVTTFCLSSATEIQPTTDNSLQLGDATHRWSNVFATLGTHNNIDLIDTSAAHNVVVGATSSVALTADRALTVDMVNGARTLKLGSNLTLATDPGSVTGAIKSNGTGTFTQAACADLSNATSACSAAVGQLPGTVTNDNASTGNVGEYVQSVVTSGSAVSVTSGACSPCTNVTSITLSAGDWDVEGVIYLLPAATTSVSRYVGSVSSTTGTLDVTPGRFADFSQVTFVSGGNTFNDIIPPSRFSLSGSTTIFLVTLDVFTVSTASAYGIIRARRVR